MALFPNAMQSSFYAGRSFGPALENVTNLRNGSLRARNTGGYWSDVNGGTPVGFGAGALVLPTVRGSMSAFVRTAVTVATASIQEGREISGSSSISFAVTPADLLLTALLSGSTSITFAVANADLGAAVGIAGSTSFSFTPGTPVLGALAGVSGSASMALAASGTLTGYGALSGSITPYTELSPQSLASAVWSAVATQFNEAGSMGNKLNSAASGGVDYAALGAAVWAALVADHNAAGTFGAEVQAGGASASEVAAQVRVELAAELEQVTKVSKIHGVGVPLVVTPTSRTAGDLSQAIATVGDTTTVSAA